MLRTRRSREPDLRRPLVVVVLSLLANVSPTLAAEPKPAGEPTAGLHVAVDPSTGRLTAPTPEQRAKLSAALAQMIDQRTEGLEVRRLPNGMRLVDLKGRFRNVAVAVRGTDGKVRFECVDGSQPSPAQRPATEVR